MTELLSRPIRGVSPTPVVPQQPLVATGILAAVSTALGGIIVFAAAAVVAWFAEDTGSFGGALRIGAVGWLFGNGGGLVVPGAVITALPLGLLLVNGWMLHRAGRWVGRRAGIREPGDAGIALASMAAAYTGVALAAYLITRSGAGHGVAWRSVLFPLLLALVGAGSGIIRESRLTSLVLDYLPEELRAALAGGVAGTAVLIAAAGLVFTGSMLVHFTQAMKLAEGLQAGVIGGIVIAVIGLAFTPNAILCAGAYLAGPGFSVGTGTDVTPGRVDLGPLPAHPLMAALPHTGGAWWQTALLVIPAVAGAAAGIVAVRRYPVAGYARRSLRGGAAGLTAGASFGALTVLATGAIGPGRMQDVGPHVLATLGVCAISALVGGVIAVVAAGWLGSSPMPADDSLS